MKSKGAAKRLTFKPKRYTTVVMMLIIWTGVLGAIFAGISTDIRSKDYLKGRAVTIADTLPVSEIESLEGSSADLNTTAYRDLKDRLQRVRRDQPDLTFAYIMGRDGAKHVFFHVDSESPDSKSYSPPGQVYGEASEKLINGFDGSETFIEGPTRDRWGMWISALAPVVDSRTNQTIAMVGIDVDAYSYYREVALYASIPLLLAAIPLAGVVRDRKLARKEHEIVDLKSQFVSIASHELRSPLTGMMWAIQSLLKSKTAFSPHDRELLNDMFTSTEASIVTVNEILDLSIFERGQAANLQHEQVDLVSVIKQVISTLKLGAKERQIAIVFRGHWPDKAFTNGDVAALKRAFMNLLSNAIKYSPQGGSVELLYRHRGSEHIIAVQDHGIGIPSAEQTKVLQGYYRAANATQMQAHGTGLGLWVTRLVIEQHGGRLWLRSHLNHGTIMYTALPDNHGQLTLQPGPKHS